MVDDVQLRRIASRAPSIAVLKAAATSDAPFKDVNFVLFLMNMFRGYQDDKDRAVHGYMAIAGNILDFDEAQKLLDADKKFMEEELKKCSPPAGPGSETIARR